MQIYLDYSATTPPRVEAIAAMQDAMTQQWGNPSSLHEWGQRAATAIERARIQVGDLLDAPPESIVFTSGGTEANNLALLGVAQKYARPQHLIISSVEHSAISEPVRCLESRGWQVTRLGVDRQGRVDPGDLQGAIQPNTVLVSIIYGQSEVGTIQPIQVLGDIARSHGILFHTDAVQVAGRLRVDVRQLPVDLLSLSSHKIYGPREWERCTCVPVCPWFPYSVVADRKWGCVRARKPFLRSSDLGWRLSWHDKKWMWKPLG